MKHIGKYDTGTRCVVIFKELPDDPNSALVVESDSLPNRWHEAFMDLVESNEAQATPNLYEILQRKLFPDGTIMLNALHVRGLLTKMPTERILMEAQPGRLYKLSEINKSIRDLTATPTDLPKTLQHPPTQQVPQPTQVNPPTSPVTPLPSEPKNENDQSFIARNLILEAEDLEFAARQKRQKALALDSQAEKRLAIARGTEVVGLPKEKPMKSVEAATPKKRGRRKKLDK